MPEPTRVHELQAFLRATAAHDRVVVRITPFDAFFDPGNDLKYLNYAIPDDAAEPSRAAIEMVRAAFLERGRLPRLEWIEEAAPRTADALREAGMREELVTPLMACAPDELRAPEVDAEIMLTGDSDAAAARRVQMVAFGEPVADDADDDNPSGVSAETNRRSVVARIDGEVVAAGGWTRVIDGISEIVGIATAEPSRGRGLAGAVTAAAARGAFGEGADLCVLSPGDETAMRVYERAGFGRVATMLHWSDVRAG
jgi:ribosomal protein S18 acetylase RimI-like enzyme